MPTDSLKTVSDLTTLPEGVIHVVDLPTEYGEYGRSVTQRWMEAANASSSIGTALREFNDVVRRDFSCGKATSIERNGQTEYQPYDLFERIDAYITEAHRLVAVKDMRLAQYDLEDLLGRAIGKQFHFNIEFNGKTRTWELAAWSDGLVPEHFAEGKDLQKAAIALKEKIDLSENCDTADHVVAPVSEPATGISAPSPVGTLADLASRVISLRD